MKWFHHGKHRRTNYSLTTDELLAQGFFDARDVEQLLPTDTYAKYGSPEWYVQHGVGPDPRQVPRDVYEDLLDTAEHMLPWLSKPIAREYRAALTKARHMLGYR